MGREQVEGREEGEGEGKVEVMMFVEGREEGERGRREY